MNFLDVIVQGIKNNLDNDNESEENIIGVVDMKPEWKKVLDEWEETDKKVEEMKDKITHLKKKFWVMVEEETGFYGQMKVKRSEGKIVMYGENKETKSSGVLEGEKKGKGKGKK